MRLIGPLSIIFAAILWSFDGFLRQSLYAASSLVVVATEHAIGAILFMPFLFYYRSQILAFSAKTWGSILWVSLFGGILGTFFYTKALSYVGYIDLSVVVLLQKLQPFFAILLAIFFLRERITSRFLILALLAFAGGYMVTFDDLIPHFAVQGSDTIAAMLAIGAAFCWGTSTVFGKHALQSGNFFFITALRLLITFLLCLVPIMIMSRGQAVIFTGFNTQQWTALLLIAFSTGAVALAIYYYGLKRVPASHSTLYELAWPLSAMIFDYVAHREFLAPTQYVGAVLLLTAMILLTREQKKPEVITVYSDISAAV
jgi:drug/metabolite transporter (DMT)-like permease